MSSQTFAVLYGHEIDKYKLRLNNKTKIYSVDEGFEFLGFRYIKKNNKLVVKVKNQTKKRFKRKIKVIYKLYLNDKLKLKDLEQVKSSYLGHLSYGNTNNLVKVTLKKYAKDKYYDLGNEVKIVNNSIVILEKK